MISIITTAKRSDAALRRSIDSVRVMGCQYPWEHIITIAEPETVPSICNDDERVKVVPAPGFGISAGFNRAIEASSGRFIIVLNSGDELVDLNHLATALLSSKNDFVYGDVVYDGVLVNARSSVNMNEILKHGMGFCHGALLVRRELHRNIGLYSEDYRICMDMELICRAVSYGARGERVAGVAAHIEKAGVSGNIWRRSVENYRVVRKYRGLIFSGLMFAKWNVAARIFGA